MHKHSQGNSVRKFQNEADDVGEIAVLVGKRYPSVGSAKGIGHSDLGNYSQLVFKLPWHICTAVILDSLQPIGGPSVEVEIDESKFMHRKYHRGLYVEGKWYLGMVERGNPGNCILVQCPNNRRDAATLLPLIQHNVLPGTTIISDQWAAYNQLQNLGYVHQTVNHTLFFRDPNTGVHSNTIEGTGSHGLTPRRSFEWCTERRRECTSRTCQNSCGAGNSVIVVLNISYLRYQNIISFDCYGCLSYKIIV